MKKYAFLIFSLILSACSTSYFGGGWDFIADKDYKNAIIQFEAALTQDAKSYETNFGLGIAYYYTKEYDNALKYLSIANSVAPTKSEIKYNLGLCYEALNNYDEALKYYQSYNDSKLDSKYKSEMENRFSHVLKLKYQSEAKKLMDQEKTISSRIDKSTLALITFENRSADPKYQPLELGFPTMFITDLAIVPTLKIVERLRIQAILSEIELNQKLGVRDQTLQRAGRLLGAKRIIKGGFTVTSNDNLALDITIFDVETGAISEPLKKTGNINEFYRMEKDLVLNIAASMGIILADDIRQKILTIPTESFFDFLEKMKHTTDVEKVEIPIAASAIETTVATTVSEVTSGPEPSTVSTRLNTVDINTGGGNVGGRNDVPSRFLPDPPLPPK